LANVNGPHPHTLIFDELEVLEDGRVFDEFRAMTQGSPGHRALDVITSTRKWLGGRIQKLMDACDDAEKRGEIPPFERFIWCVFETLQNQPNCGTTCGCSVPLFHSKPVRATMGMMAIRTPAARATHKLPI